MYDFRIDATQSYTHKWTMGTRSLPQSRCEEHTFVVNKMNTSTLGVFLGLDSLLLDTQHDISKIRILITQMTTNDMKCWYHLSLSHTPTYKTRFLPLPNAYTSLLHLPMFFYIFAPCTSKTAKNLSRSRLLNIHYIVSPMTCYTVSLLALDIASNVSIIKCMSCSQHNQILMPLYFHEVHSYDSFTRSHGLLAYSIKMWGLKQPLTLTFCTCWQNPLSRLDETEKGFTP